MTDRLPEAPLKDSSERCPLCDADLQGDPIPADIQHYYGNHTHFSRMIGHTDRALDRTTHWSCPDCKGTWNR